MTATASSDRWLLKFSDAAAKSDRLKSSQDHVSLLAAGLFGEAGSVVAELKKSRRDTLAYPIFKERMLEEVGDFLWYYVRLVAAVDRDLLEELRDDITPHSIDTSSSATAFLELASRTGATVEALSQWPDGNIGLLRPRLEAVWEALKQICRDSALSLRDAAEANNRKTSGLWPEVRRRVGLFDEGFPEEEQLPRRLEIEFRELPADGKKSVILRCNGVSIGDRLTDNIQEPDGYRFHDVFHFANAAYLGWSPVVRALLKCKRKSQPRVDEAQDGARAIIIEEAISTIVFAHAKQVRYFAELDHVSLDLLKTLGEFVVGYEVEVVPLWQWEEAILEAYATFRRLRENGGGQVIMDLSMRRLEYKRPGAGPS